MPALALDNPPRRDSQRAVISSASAKLIKAHPLISSTSSNPPKSFEKRKYGCRQHADVPELHRAEETKSNAGRLGALPLECQMPLDRRVRQPIRKLRPFIPVLAAVPIKQLTCLLTRSSYLCCTAAGLPGCPSLSGGGGGCLPNASAETNC